MKTKINLIPSELRREEKGSLFHYRKDMKLPLLGIAAVLIWKLCSGMVIVKFRNDLKRFQAEIDSYNQKISVLKASVETDLKARQEKMDGLKVMITDKEGQVKDFGSIAELVSKKERFVYDLLVLVANSISEGVWIDGLAFDKETNDFSLQGFALTHPQIGTFLTKLGQSPHLTNLYMNNCETASEGAARPGLLKFDATGKFKF